jgi:hypothetical protein
MCQQATVLPIAVFAFIFAFSATLLDSYRYAVNVQVAKPTHTYVVFGADDVDHPKVNHIGDALELPLETPVAVIGVPSFRDECAIVSYTWELSLLPTTNEQLEVVAAAEQQISDAGSSGLDINVQVVWSNWCRPFFNRRPFHLAGIDSADRKLLLPPAEDVHSFGFDILRTGLTYKFTKSGFNFSDRDVCMIVSATQANSGKDR